MTAITFPRRPYTCSKCGKQFIKNHKCPNKNIETKKQRAKREGRY